MFTAASIDFSHAHYDIKYVQMQNTSTATAVLYGHVLCLYKNFKKFASTSNLLDSCAQIFLNTL